MNHMGKLIGVIVFSAAMGMILTVLISNRLVALIVAAILLLVSYNMMFFDR